MGVKSGDKSFQMLNAQKRNVRLYSVTNKRKLTLTCNFPTRNNLPKYLTLDLLVIFENAMDQWRRPLIGLALCLRLPAHFVHHVTVNEVIPGLLNFQLSKRSQRINTSRVRAINTGTSPPDWSHFTAVCCRQFLFNTIT